MVANATLPPPKPKFPIQFDEGSISNERIGLGAPPTGWPDVATNAERSTTPAWEIKNDSEVYVERLGALSYSSQFNPMTDGVWVRQRRN